MSLSNLFTVDGLFEAIKTHHKNLHENYNFPPLSGMKPIHKFAETLGLKNAEQLKASLSTLSSPVIHQNVHINLSDTTFAEQVSVYYESEDSTLRIDVYDQPSFLIVTVDNDISLIQPSFYYLSSNIAIITYNYIQIFIKLDKDQVVASVIEDKNKENLNYLEFQLYKSSVNEIDKQRTSINFDIEKYSDEIFEYIQTVDNTILEVNSEYIDCAKDDELNSIQAANDWFAEYPIRYKLVSTKNGYKDYNVIGHHTLRRLKVPNNVKINDVINMYHGESTKTGLIWKGDILSSIQNAISVLNK